MGRVGGDVERFGFPVTRRENTVLRNWMPRSRAETWIQARAAHGPERASRLRRGNLGLDSEPLGAVSFPLPLKVPGQSPLPYLAQTWHSKIEIRDQNRCLRCLLLVICTHPFAKAVLTLHLARSEGRERYFGCNLMQRKVLRHLTNT